MKTNVSVASVDCFYSRVQDDKSSQHALILSVMDEGRGYTGQELFHLTDLVPGTISARLGELRAELKVRRSEVRSRCPHSGVRVFTHRKLPAQLDIFA